MSFGLSSSSLVRGKGDLDRRPPCIQSEAVFPKLRLTEIAILVSESSGGVQNSGLDWWYLLIPSFGSHSSVVGVRRERAQSAWAHCFHSAVDLAKARAQLYSHTFRTIIHATHPLSQSRLFQSGPWFILCPRAVFPPDAAPGPEICTLCTAIFALATGFLLSAPRDHLYLRIGISTRSGQPFFVLNSRGKLAKQKINKYYTNCDTRKCRLLFRVSGLCNSELITSVTNSAYKA